MIPVIIILNKKKKKKPMIPVIIILNKKKKKKPMIPVIIIINKKSTPSLTHSLTHSLTRSLPPSPIHSLTHSPMIPDTVGDVPSSLPVGKARAPIIAPHLCNRGVQTYAIPKEQEQSLHNASSCVRVFGRGPALCRCVITLNQDTWRV